MKVRPVNPEAAAGLLDPVTKRSPFIDPETKAVLASAEVPDTVHWRRRLLHGEIALDVSAQNEPTGTEPLAPLTTRAARK